MQIQWAQVYNCPPLPHLHLCKKETKCGKDVQIISGKERARFCTGCKGDGVIWAHTPSLCFDNGGHIISKLTYNMEADSRTPGWKSIFSFSLKPESHATQAVLKLGRWPRTPDLPVFSRVLGLQTCTARPVLLISAMLGTECRPPGSREGLEVKSTGYSAEGSRFISQHPHGSSQLFLIPVPGDRAPSHRHTCMQNTKAHKIKIKYWKENNAVLHEC